MHQPLQGPVRNRKCGKGGKRALPEMFYIGSKVIDSDGCAIGGADEMPNASGAVLSCSPS